MDTKNIFIFHGAYGNPQENWIPWLRSSLEKENLKVIVPVFPTPDNQSLESWQNIFKPYLSKINDDTIIVAHSVGVPFALSLLEDVVVTIKASFFIAGFHVSLDNPKVQEINKTFVEKEFNWETIKRHCQNFYMLSGDNDPYIDLDISRDLAQELEAPLTVVKDGGHLNATAGYTEFPLLLEKIKAVL